MVRTNFPDLTPPCKCIFYDKQFLQHNYVIYFPKIVYLFINLANRKSDRLIDPAYTSRKGQQIVEPEKSITVSSSKYYILNYDAISFNFNLYSVLLKFD